MAPKRKPASLPIETEAKIRVASFTPVRRRLAMAEGRLVSARTLETNTLFDSADRSLVSGGRSLRVRRYGRQGVLTLKGVATVNAGLKSRIELETLVASPERMTEILSSLGFEPLFRYEKFREVWVVRGAEVCLDETPLGRFVEIEGRNAAIRKVVALLGLEGSEFLTASYPALWSMEGRPGDMVFERKAGSRKARR